MNRRKFIKGMLGTSLVTAGNCMFRVPLLSSAQASPAGSPTVVVIFQRGGCDGLSTVVPYGDNNYYNLRPNIAIPAPGSGAQYSALDLDGFFGLHPSMSSLLPFYDAQKMAILPAVHYPMASQSHFESQRYIESGISLDNLGGADIDNLDGWLNRHLQIGGNSPLPLQAVGFGDTLTQALRGNIPVQSFSMIDAFNLGLTGSDEQSLIDGILPVYEELQSSHSPARKLVKQFGGTLFGNLDLVGAIDTASYTPSNNAVYPSGLFGRRLKETAQLIKKPEFGLQVVAVDMEGYDTHSEQGGGEPEGVLSGRLKEFSDGIAALMTDLGNKMDDVIILSMTEFGRTLAENGSLGTDHGNAASWFAFGNKIQGGIYPENQWPGLAEEDLFRGRYLASNIDYRDILGDILVNHLGHVESELSSLLPGHSYQGLNLVSA